MDLQRWHARRAAALVPIAGARVLVVGCNRGGDCALMIEAGAAHVTGVDVIEDVGRDFADPRVTYLRCDVAALDLPPTAAFHLVYSLATLEHVQALEAAFVRMTRLTAEGGAVYAVSSPLWRSRNGHHAADLFGEHPWIHLLEDAGGAIAALAAHGPTPEEVQHRIRHLWDSAELNKRPGADYVAAAAAAVDPTWIVLRNALEHEPHWALEPSVAVRLAERGYTPDELLAVTHSFVALRAPSWRTRVRARLRAMRQK